jgi:hypothetical protein
MQKVSALQFTGVTTRMDGDVIRVEMPTDMVFTPGTYQVSLTSAQLLQQIAGVINREFPKQLIGVESHRDSTLPPPAGRNLSSSLRRRSRSRCSTNWSAWVFLSGSFFTLAMGANRPGYASGPSRSEPSIKPAYWDRRLSRND